jgi:hypothetical protein
MCQRVMLGEIVSIILFAWCPLQIELSLRDPVLEPVVAHVEGLGMFHAHGGMENAVSSRVVGFDRCPGWWLFVAHFFKGGANGDSLLRIEEQAADFGFGR